MRRARVHFVRKGEKERRTEMLKIDKKSEEEKRERERERKKERENEREREREREEML